MAKSRIRRVRSAEGMRYYGLPMGAPITASAIKNAKSNGKSFGTVKKQKGGTTREAARHKKELKTPAEQRLKISENPQSLRQPMVVQQGSSSYTIPAGYTAFQPEGKDFTVAISPSENVTLISQGGLIEVQGEAQEALLDMAFPDSRSKDSDRDSSTKSNTPDAPAAPSSDTSGEQDSEEGTQEREDAERRKYGELPADFRPTEKETNGLTNSPITGPWIDKETGYYNEERRALHREIIERLLDGIEPPKDGKPTLYFNGGGPASGKGTMTKGSNARLTNYPSSRGADEFTGALEDVPNPEALLIDPDIMKLQIPEARDALDRVRRGVGTEQDRDWANSAHNESSDLSAQLYRAALARGINVIFDGTGNGSVSSVTRKVTAAKERGYRVEANYISLNPEEGIKRALSRADRSHRVVPNSAIANTYQNIPEIFDAVKNDLFDKVNLFDNNVPMGELARLIGRGEGGNFEILDTVAYARFMASKDKAFRARRVFEDGPESAHLGSTPAERMASVMIEEANEVEPYTTRKVEHLAKSFGLELAGREFRLKTKGSLQRKIAGEVSSGDARNEYEAGMTMKDVVRYTMLTSPDEYAESLQKILENFHEEGYQINVKNTWGNQDNPYNGVNIQLRTPSGYPFELQMHTPESFEVKNGKMHSLYELYRITPDDDIAIKDSLTAQMKELSRSMVVPKKITEMTFPPEWTKR